MTYDHECHLYVYLDAKRPNGKDCFSLKISRKRMRDVSRRGMGQTLEMAHVLPEVLKDPRAIFSGLRTDEDEPRDDYSLGHLCYVGMPSKAYSKVGIQINPRYAQVYLAFVNDEDVVYNWRWEKADMKDLYLPKYYESRFKKRIL